MANLKEKSLSSSSLSTPGFIAEHNVAQHGTSPLLSSGLDVLFGLLLSSCTGPTYSPSLEWRRSSAVGKKAKALCLQSLLSNSYTIAVLPAPPSLATNPKFSNQRAMKS